MSFIDKMKGRIKGKSIDDEIDSAFREENSYSKRVLEANQRPQRDDAVSRSPKWPAAPKTHISNAGHEKAPFEQSRTNPMLKAQQNRLSQQAVHDLPDEETFMRQRFGTDNIEDKDIPPPPDLIGIPGTEIEKEDIIPKLEKKLGSHHIGTDRINEELLLGIKDLRAQNNHIIDLLRNIQDRLSKY